MESSNKAQSNETTVKSEMQGNGKLGSYTLFSVTHETRESRSERIRALFREQPVFGYLLAVFDFEWTIRRAVVMMSPCPAMVIKARFATTRCSGLGGYQRIWNDCVRNMRKSDSIPTLDCVANGVESMVGLPNEEKEAIQNAMHLRHVLVHGISGSLPRAKADTGIEVLLSATERIEAFVLGCCGKPVFARIHKPRAYCKKCRKHCDFRKEKETAEGIAREKKKQARKAAGRSVAR